MILNFKSISKQKGEEKENEIKFSALLDYELESGVYIYRFEEPSQKILNQIEVNPQRNTVTIFAGPTTLNLELNREIKNKYVVTETTQNFFLIVTMTAFNFISEKDINFEYDIMHENHDLIGHFYLELKTGEN